MDDEEESNKIRETAFKKTGAELFRELLRHYIDADINDYFKNGQWRNEAMKADLILVHAHRREAGAPDPLPLDKVPMPKVPSPLGFAFPGIAMPKGITSLAGATTSLQHAAVSNGLAELRAMALFVAKWKLEPMRTKQLLGRLTPEKRRQVLQSFTLEPGIAPEFVNDVLEQFVAKIDDGASADILGGQSKAPPPSVTAPSAMAISAGLGLSKAASMASVAAEMRLITLFVAKFKLDAIRTKTLLNGVPASKRTQVIQGFTTHLVGVEATDALEHYISEFVGSNGDNGELAGFKRAFSALEVVENGDLKRPFVVPPVPTEP